MFVLCFIILTMAARVAPEWHLHECLPPSIAVNNFNVKEFDMGKRGRQILNLSGKKFGKLSVIKFDSIGASHNALWECICDCGNNIIVKSNNLKSGNTRSCGCLHKEMLLRKWDPINIDNRTLGIPLSRKKIALIDKEDLDKIKDFGWCFDGSGYARSTIKNKSISMHRLIMNISKEYQIDHINHNGLDNRKSNLRICTPSQNAMNAKNRKINEVGYRGVCIDKTRTHIKWIARLGINGKRLYLGRHNSPEEAAIAYKSKAKELFGDFYNPCI